MSEAVKWDGTRWVAPGAGLWWDGVGWRPMILDVGDYSVSADNQYWYDGQTWRPIDRRPTRSFVRRLLIVDAILFVLFVPLLVGMAASLVTACPGVECSLAADGWFVWLLTAGFTLTPIFILTVSIVLAIRKRRQPMATPAALLDLLEKGLSGAPGP